jgi:hypothetical protein
MDDPASGRHPLYVTRFDEAGVFHAVFVRHPAVDRIGDCLDATVGVPGKSGLSVLAAIFRRMNWLLRS